MDVVDGIEVKSALDRCVILSNPFKPSSDSPALDEVVRYIFKTNALIFCLSFGTDDKAG